MQTLAHFLTLLSHCFITAAKDLPHYSKIVPVFSSVPIPCPTTQRAISVTFSMGPLRSSHLRLHLHYTYKHLTIKNPYYFSVSAWQYMTTSLIFRVKENQKPRDLGQFVTIKLYRGTQGLRQKWQKHLMSKMLQFMLTRSENKSILTDAIQKFCLLKTKTNCKLQDNPQLLSFGDSDIAERIRH